VDFQVKIGALVVLIGTAGSISLLIWYFLSLGVRREAARLVTETRDAHLAWAELLAQDDWREQVEFEDVVGTTEYHLKEAEKFSLVLVALGGPQT